MGLIWDVNPWPWKAPPAGCPAGVAARLAALWAPPAGDMLPAPVRGRWGKLGAALSQGPPAVRPEGNTIESAGELVFPAGGVISRKRPNIWGLNCRWLTRGRGWGRCLGGAGFGRGGRAEGAGPRAGLGGWVACVSSLAEPAVLTRRVRPALVLAQRLAGVSRLLGACLPAAFALLARCGSGGLVRRSVAGPTRPVSALRSPGLTRALPSCRSAPVALFPVVVLVGCADSAGTSSAEPASAFPGLFPPTVASTMCAAPRTSSAALL